MFRLTKSFRHAIDGLKLLLKEEPNYLIHLLLTGGVIILGMLFKISPGEWLAIVVTTGLVLVTETLNTSIENIMDFISTKRQPPIKRIKDLSAAAVLIAATTAVIVGLIIFLPKVIKLLQ